MVKLPEASARLPGPSRTCQSETLSSPRQQVHGRPFLMKNVSRFQGTSPSFFQSEKAGLAKSFPRSPKLAIFDSQASNVARSVCAPQSPDYGHVIGDVNPSNVSRLPGNSPIGALSIAIAFNLRKGKVLSALRRIGRPPFVSWNTPPEIARKMNSGNSPERQITK